MMKAKRWAVLLGMLLLGGVEIPAFAVICPGQTLHSQSCTLLPSVASGSEEFENVANTLRAGDELVLRGGTYSQTGRRAITVNGTASQPAVIRAYDGESPLLTRPLGDYSQNNIEVVSSAYLVLRGLRFQGGSSGVRFMGGHHITFEENEIFDTGNNALTANSGDTDAFTIRRNHIHHTGLDTSGTTEGEGMYLGCNNNSCRMTNSVIENNYIHHLRGTSQGGNDGIEVKVGSGGNIVRNNVIHDTTIGTRFPCIFVYGGGSAPNTVEGNAMWNCGEAIQVAADAVIRNNLILNSDIGITAGPHAQVPSVRNVSIVNNTIAGHDRCLSIGWSGASNAVLANNAVYCSNATAVSGSFAGTGVTLRTNYVEGTVSGAQVDGNAFVAGGGASVAFNDPANMDYWPTGNSILLGKADAAYVPARDFNDTLRTTTYDVGAYETEGLASNPGWRVVAGFKTGGSVGNPVPVVTLTASPSAVTSGASATVTWSSSDATSCQSSGAWSGVRPTTGSFDTGPLTSSSVYSLTCNGPGGSGTQSATVTVSGGSGGGSSGGSSSSTSG
jgi:hypothetical protein